MLKIVKLKVFGVQYVLKLYGGSNPARERVIFRRQGEEVACIHCIHATTEFSTLWQVVKEDYREYQWTAGLSSQNWQN